MFQKNTAKASMNTNMSSQYDRHFKFDAPMLLVKIQSGPVVELQIFYKIKL